MALLYLCYHCKPPDTTVTGTIEPNMPGVWPQLCSICFPPPGVQRPVLLPVVRQRKTLS